MKTTSATSYINSSVTAGKKYYYKVKAIAENSAANSAFSTVKARTAKLAQPKATVSLNSADKPVVSWGKVNGAVSYKVYRAASAHGEYKLMKTTTSLSYTDTSAAKGATYYYKVKAICSNADGSSAYSAVKSIRT